VTTPQIAAPLVAVRARPFSAARILRDAATPVGLLFGAWLAIFVTGRPIDAHAYWSANLDNPYTNAVVFHENAYLYSPAFLQLTHPLTLLPWEVFLPLWRLSIVAFIALLAGPLTLPVLLLEPTMVELNTGNIHALMALAIVAGFRWPGTWALLLLTKITPGIGLLWFAVRREWRSLAIALGVTFGIALGSFLIAPGLWVAWIQVLLDSGNTGQTASGPIPLPLGMRLVIAAVVVTWGALRNRRWTVPVAAYLGLPVLYPHSAVLLLAVVPLVDWAHWPPRTWWASRRGGLTRSAAQGSQAS
jgi:hypothetical protein